MVDLTEKSREEVIREKKEAELRLAKRKEGEWKRRMDKERKCMIGGTFLKYFKDSLLFEPDEWDRIVQEVIKTDAFKQTIEAIRKEAAIKQKQKEQMSKAEGKTDNPEIQQARSKEQKNHNTPETAKQENARQEHRPEGGNNGQ